MQSAVTDQPSSGDRAPTQIEYVLDPEDHVACHMLLSGEEIPKAPPIQAIRPAHWFVGAVIVGGLAVVFVATGGTGVEVMGLLLLAVFLLLLGAVQLMNGPPVPVHDRLLVVKDRVRELQRFGVVKVGRRDRVTLDADGFTEINEYQNDAGGVRVVERRETRVRWSAVTDVIVFDGLAVFAVGGHGILIVPGRAFADADAFHRFVENASALRESFVARTRDEITANAPVRPDQRLQLPSSP